ncbi:MAG: SPOR domain-containing protein, partial [Aliihoeflea sp.]
DQSESAGDPVETNPAADELDEAFADFDLTDDLQSEIAAEPQLVADPISFDESDTELGQFSEPAPHHSEIWTSGVEAVSDDDLDLAFDAELEVAEDMAAEPVAATGDQWRFDEQTAHEDVAAEYDVQDEPFVGGSTHFAETDAAETAPTFAHDDVLQAGPAADHEQQTEYAQEPEASLAWTPLKLQTEGPVESVAAHVEPQFSSPFEPQLRREIADDDDVLNDIESWLGADSEPAAPAVAAASVTTRPVFTAVDPAPVAVAPETSGPAAVESETLSLEDELSALLGDDVALQVPAREEAIDWHEPTPYEAGDAQPVVTNAPPVESEEIEIALDFDFDEPDLEQEYAPQPTAWQETEEYGWDGGQEATAFEVETSDQDDFDAAAFSASRPSSDNLVEEPVAPKKSGPLAMLAALAPAAIARFGGGERSSVARSTEAAQPATPLFGLARANRPVPPEIETVDVEDQPVALADDLDIPDLTEPEDVAPLFSPDDLEAELDVAFGSLATEEELPAPQQKAASAQALEQPPLQGYFADGDYAYTPQEGAVGSEFGDVEFDDDADDEDFDARQSAPKDGMRRKYFILGGVAAIAIIGGLGYFVSGGPVGDGAPAIVRADPEPVRVRPENRGGATVPNQNSQAYRRATGATGEPGGGQEQLVTSVEEPMDVRAAVAPSEPMDDFPLVGMEEIPMLGEAEANEMLASVKSHERLGSVEDIIEEDSIEIAPRRVRTMVVRPDGTLVPRDEVPPAATRAELEATTVAAASGQGTAVPLVQDAQPIGTLVPQSEVLADDPVMPDTVGVVPSRPQPSAAPVSQPAPVQLAAAEAPAAQAPVAQSASAAPAVGEWSMQIASQPTAEGAQSAYQDLARRYGSVLEGKGVNIVRADIEGMGTFYRVRIPAATRDEAINLCESFKGAGGNCFVSR